MSSARAVKNPKKANDANDKEQVRNQRRGLPGPAQARQPRRMAAVGLHAVRVRCRRSHVLNPDRVYSWFNGFRDANLTFGAIRHCPLADRDPLGCSPLSRSVDLFDGAFRYLGFEELTWTVRVSVVQFISSVSALTAVGGAAGLSGEAHLGSVMVLDLAGLRGAGGRSCACIGAGRGGVA
jgi:hypothetical protein